MGSGLVSPSNKGSDGAREHGSVGERRTDSPAAPHRGASQSLLLWGCDPHVSSPVFEVCSSVVFSAFSVLCNSPR